MRKLNTTGLNTTELAAAQGAGPAPTGQRPIRDLPRTGRRKAPIRTQYHAPRRTY
ncbi:hypothetical protein [Streptomyces inhibens]|uniref:hypothetical protein n=1 Tax=Streptomyces inhibens TaxID=2293571 RepID=UPI0015F27CD9|nr:hypothetical protein [Streptomyces inhibens]